MRTAPLPRPPSVAEQRLFYFLLEVNRKYDLQLTLRVAGGWVRDQLLGLECHDIDIALDGPTPPGEEAMDDGQSFMTGAKFAEFIQRHQHETGEESHSFGVVKTNPGQSKHLETATSKICGFEIDLVHLRKEDYASDSRIPTAQRASPEEDAFRRDLTINALFYNLHTQLAEDFTDKGFEDLQRKYVRTPLPPLETFRDDPLRLLRCIRFACKLEFEVDPAILGAGREVLGDLALKVSRERVGIEVGKMLEGPHPDGAATLMHACGVRDVVFTSQQINRKKVPEGTPAPLGWEEDPASRRGWARSQALLQRVVRSAVFQAEADKELRQVMSLAALLLGVSPDPDPEASLSVAVEHCHGWVESVTTHSLKLPNRIATACTQLLVGAKTLLPLLATPLAADDVQAALEQFLAPGHGLQSGRVTVGEWLRVVGPVVWRPAVVLGCYATPGAPDPDLLVQGFSAAQMVQCADLKPAVRGDVLQKALNLPKGPAVGFATTLLLRLQMAFPTFAEAQLLEAMGPHVEAVKAQAEESRTKRPRT